jgi:hypothetical protein
LLIYHHTTFRMKKKGGGEGGNCQNVLRKGSTVETIITQNENQQ